MGAVFVSLAGSGRGGDAFPLGGRGAGGGGGGGSGLWITGADLTAAGLAGALIASCLCCTIGAALTASCLCCTIGAAFTASCLCCTMGAVLTAAVFRAWTGDSRCWMIGAAAPLIPAAASSLAD